MSTAEEYRVTLLTLYPIFKEEVYRRRHEMMRWTAIGMGGLVAILVILLLAPPTAHLTIAGRVLMSGGVLLWTATIATLLLQQRDRHRQAKQILIELERELGLFEKIAGRHDRSLYPARWQTDWLRDRSIMLSLLLLGLLTLITIVAALLIPA